MPPLTCRQFIEFLDDYLEGTQSEAVRRSFERHLAACPECTDYLRTFRDTIRMGKAAFAADADDPVPSDVPGELVRAVLEITTGSSSPRIEESH